MPWFGSSPFGGGREGIRPKRQDGGGSSGRGMQNPIHFQPPMLAVPRSTVVTDESGKEVALHTVKLEHEGWVWHVHLHWRQLQTLASALQRWHWRVFFFPKTIPPLPAIHEGQAVSSPPRSRSRAGRQGHHRRARDDHDLEWAGYEEDTTAAADAEVASVYSGRSGVSTEQGQRQGGRPHRRVRRPRRAHSAPPVSASGSEGEEEEELATQPRRQHRRERRRWEYYSHETSFGSGSAAAPALLDLRVPLSLQQASQTDPASLAHQRTVCERYLRAVLRNVSHRHCPALLELLEISARSFDPAQGPSYREGFLASACYWAKEGSEGEDEETAAGLDVGGLVAAAMEGEGGWRTKKKKKSHLPGALHQPTQPKPPPHAARALQRCYAVLKMGALSLYATREGTEEKGPEAVLLFEHGTKLEAFVFDATCPEGSSARKLVLRNSLWHFELALSSLVQQRLWAAALQTVLAGCPWVERSRFDFTRALPLSYLDDSAVSTAQWLVDGEAVYSAYAAAIKGAKASIFLGGQWVCPDLFLRRPAHRFPDSRLERLLDAKAKEGVSIFVLLAHEEPLPGQRCSDAARHAQARLMSLPHAPGRIHVLLAGGGDGGVHAWTHHDNLLIVDQELAFLGSTTLGLGQYDTPHHLLKDDTLHSSALAGPNNRGSRRSVRTSHHRGPPPPRARKTVWPGRDYWNPLAKDMTGEEKAHTPADLPFHDRSCVPRLPHHTAVAALGGSAARDAGWHFIGRWNLARARHRARIARLKYQGTHPDVLLAASATGRFPSPPALAPHGVWRMATAMTTTGVSTALGGEPVEGAKPTGVSGGGGNAGAKGSGSAVLVRKTVARLVFGAHSSVAPPPPPPETDGLLTPAEAARKDLLTEVEEAASSKVRAWLRPARKVASRRLLELQHDQGLSARAELWGRYQAMVVAALPFAPRPAPARIKRHNRALHHRKPQQPLTPSSAHLPVSEEGEWFDAGFERQGGKSNSGKYTGLLPSDETAAPAAAGEIKAIPTTDTSQEQQREESPKPLLPSVVKAHVQAARLSSSSQSGLVASPPTATVHQAARLPSCQRAMVPIKSPPNQPPPPPQRVYHEYLRLKRTWYLKEAEEEEQEAASMGPPSRCHARVVRSLGRWSGGLKQTEAGVLEAYEQLIASARHYVYLETPALVSGLRGDTGVGNRIAEALLNRIVRAHDRGERFRALVLLPLLPVYDGPLHGSTNATLTSALYYQLATVRALKEKLCALVPDPEEHLQFLSLRTYTRMNGRPAQGTGPHFVAQQIHVNSRLLIADDRHCILGSAALNDRSLLGGRDSEVCVVLEDTEPSDCTGSPPTMDGKPFPQAGRFARGLRLRLWGEHLGLLDDRVRCAVLRRVVSKGEGEGGLCYEGEGGGVEWAEPDVTPQEVAFAPILDPVAPETWAFLRATARKNTAILAHVFPRAVPSDQITSLEALKQVTLQQAALPGTYDFVQAVLGAEQAQDEADMLDDFIQQGAMHQARARGEEDEEEVSSMEELEAGGEEDVYEEEEEEAFLEAQLQDERCATLRWLRRLKGHVVQYPADFLCEDLPALKPLNGLEGLVL